MQEINEGFYFLRSNSNGLGYLLKLGVDTINISAISDKFQACLLDKLVDGDKVLLIDNMWTTVDFYFYSITEKRYLWHVQGISGNLKCEIIYNVNPTTKLFTIINKQDGKIKWQFNFAQYIVFDKAKSFRKTVNFDFLTSYENQLICVVNSDKILSIDINTSEILWELTESKYENSEVKMDIFQIDFFGVVDNIVYVLQRSIYLELDIIKKECIIKKDFRIDNADNNLRCLRCTFYKGKFYFLADFGESMNTNNKFGIFNIETKQVEKIIEIKLPRGVFLRENPVVDDKYLYIKDSAHTIYIYERGKDF